MKKKYKATNIIGGTKNSNKF